MPEYDENYELKAPVTATSNEEVETSSYDNSLDEKKNVVDVVAQHMHDVEVIIDRMREAGDMDDILAEGGADFFADKVQSISQKEAIEILQYSYEYHVTDINFPAGTLSRIKQLLKGEEVYGKGPVFYDLDLRLEAALMKYHSPYPEVRSVCSPTDDPTIPVETFRAYVIGIFWVAVGGFINQLIYFRQPHFTLTSQVIQLLLLPCGQFLAKVVPHRKIRIWKWSIDLNPGPWTFKEQMFATIITNVGAQNSVWGQYAPVIREKIFYNQTWATYDFSILINIICQFFGFGMAGVLRRWCVYPSKAVWPTMLPTLQLNRTLLTPETKRTINGWKISKYRLFNILLAFSFVYFFIPDFLFTALSTFNWMTWIAPNNKNLAFVTGSKIGAGFNPIASFDWSVLNYASPMVVPFFTYANRYAGMVVAAIVLLILYYTNFQYTAYMPPNTSDIFDRYGEDYNLTRVLSNGLFDLEQYKEYSPPYVTAGYYMYLCASFAIYTLAFVYILLNEWRTFRDAIVGLYNGLRNRKVSTYAQYKDSLSVMMREYQEVPDWWFLIILAVSFVVACVVMKCYPTTMPVWATVVIIIVAIVITIPVMLLYSYTGFFMSTNMLGTIIGGYMIPGNGVACVFTRALGFCVEDQAETYVGDQKLAHYAKLPPRAVFRGQFIGTVVQVFVTAGAMELAHTVENFCSWNQGAKFTCAWSHSIYSGSLLFGVIGPDRTLDTLYPMIKWCFLIGALMAIPLYFARERYPKYLRSFHPVLFLGGFTLFGSTYNLSYYTPGLYLSVIMMYYVRRRYLGWWSKYNYIITSGFTAGTAFSGILIFLALQYKPKSLKWWGTTVQNAGVDGKGVATLKVIPADLGYFGVPSGTWS
ncbi:OPT oligopeptide transporter protein-domain-containing protein [Lipomyces tetrasporus]